MNKKDGKSAQAGQNPGSNQRAGDRFICLRQRLRQLFGRTNRLAHSLNSRSPIMNCKFRCDPKDSGQQSPITSHFSPVPLPVIRSNQDRGGRLPIPDDTTKTGRGTQFTSRRVILPSRYWLNTSL